MELERRTTRSYTLGSVIANNCRIHHISYRQLCQGIVSLSTLRRLVNETIEPEKFIVDQLLERVGVCPDQFEVWIDDKDWYWFCKRDAIRQAYNQKDYRLMGELIQEYKELCPRIYPSYLQYGELMQAYLYKNQADGEQFLKQSLYALHYTISDLTSIVWEQAYFSMQELHILILIAEGYWKVGKQLLAVDLLKHIIAYPFIRQIERKEALKFIPYARFVLARIYTEMGKKKEARKECWRGIDFLQENQCVIGIIPLMEQLLLLLDERQEIYEKLVFRLKEWKAVFQTYDVPFDMLYPIQNYENCYIISESIQSYRLLKGMTQEQFCEGICSVRAFRDIEKGKTSPKTFCFNDLMSRCGLPKTKYIQWNNTENEQLETMFAKKVGLLPNQAIQQYEDLLCNKIVGYPDINLERYPFMLYETVIINYLACSYGESGNYLKAIELLGSIYKSYQNSRTTERLSYKGYCLTLKNLANYLQLSNRKKQAAEIDGELMRRELHNGHIEYANVITLLK